MFNALIVVWRESLEAMLADLKKELSVEIGVRVITPVAF